MVPVEPVCLTIIIIKTSNEYLLVNKQRSLSIPSVTPVISASNFNRFIIEEVRHLRLRVSVHEPEKIQIVAFHAVLRVVFLAKEPWSLGIPVVGRTFDVKVSREVGGGFGPEVDAGFEVGDELGRVGLQLGAVGDGVRRGVADPVFVLDADAELVVAEGFQVTDVADAGAQAGARREPVPVRHLTHLHLYTIYKIRVHQMKGEENNSSLMLITIAHFIAFVDVLPFYCYINNLLAGCHR